MGRFLFDECLPPGFGYITETVKKKQMGESVDRLANEFPKAVVAASLDALKNLWFTSPPRSGLPLSIDAAPTPPQKPAILATTEPAADKDDPPLQNGIITASQRPLTETTETP